MSSRTTRPVSLLSCLLLGLLALTPSTSEACGPYGGHWLAGEVTTEVARVAQAKVVAKCGADEFSTEVDENGRFWLMGIPASAKVCKVRAVVLDEDGAIHTARERVELPKRELSMHVARR